MPILTILPFWNPKAQAWSCLELITIFWEKSNLFKIFLVLKKVLII
jgi:hypothetical protein